MFMVGIDPGVTTGFAVWDRRAKKFELVTSMMIHEAMDCVQRYVIANTIHSVLFEDARLRRWLGQKGREALQGAGSIKRDCGIWADYLGALGVPYRSVAPADNMTKLKASEFERITKWTGRTNEHARDAAMLVFGR